MNSQPPSPGPVRIDSVAGLLAVIPHLLGFTPHHSLVLLGLTGPRGRVKVAFRFDLPDPPGPGAAAQIAGHIAGVLARQGVAAAVAAGYGPGRLVTPLADALRRHLPAAGVEVRDVLRVQDGRYWSYLCQDPACCPPEGKPYDPAGHPAAGVLARAGLTVAPSREAVAATIGPLTGPRAEEMAAAVRQAERIAERIITVRGPDGLDQPGLAAVRAAVEAYRDGGSITAPVRHAWLALVLTRLRIRDDAWARMDPAHHLAHRRLWTDVTRRAQPGYVAAPASLLALTAWQAGDGALANLALDRALADEPGYRMALLLRDALTAGAPPSMAAPTMTPEQVSASYAAQDTSRTGDSGERADPARPGTSN